MLSDAVIEPPERRRAARLPPRSGEDSRQRASGDRSDGNQRVALIDWHGCSASFRRARLDHGDSGPSLRRHRTRARLLHERPRCRAPLARQRGAGAVLRGDTLARSRRLSFIACRRRRCWRGNVLSRGRRRRGVQRATRSRPRATYRSRSRTRIAGRPDMGHARVLRARSRRELFAVLGSHPVTRHVPAEATHGRRKCAQP